MSVIMKDKETRSSTLLQLIIKTVRLNLNWAIVCLNFCLISENESLKVVKIKNVMYRFIVI